MIGDTIEKVVEGDTIEKVVESLRVEALKKHLTNYNTSLEVWMTEDGSGVINKVEYDPTNNTSIGLILPKNKNSMPIKLHFQATPAKAIEDHFNNNQVSSLIYIYIAQTNNPDVPPFCLLFFGTDNRMVFSDVLKETIIFATNWKKSVLGFLDIQAMAIRGS